MNLLWSLERALQLLGMFVVGTALIVGFQSSDAFSELKYMLAGAAVFVCGLVIVHSVESKR